MDDSTSKSPFFRIESLAVMDHRVSEASAVTSVDDASKPEHPPPPSPSSSPSTSQHELQETEELLPVVLAVQPFRGRTLLLTVVVIAALVSLMLLFIDGFALTDFDASDLTAKEQSQLLDDYNSYSGNVATIFSKPVEIFVTLGAQMIVLTFLGDAVMRPSPSFTATAAVTVLSSGAGYLVRNGISALNVQLHPIETIAVIGPSDLSVLVNQSLADAAMPTSTVNGTFAEMRPENPSTNTILRNLLLPLPVRPATQCTQAASGAFETVAEPMVQFGIPKLDWQNRVLPQAVAATKQLKIVVNTPSSSATKPPTPDDLPMDASIAADLFLYAMIEAPRSLPWGQQLAFYNQSNWSDRFPLAMGEDDNVRAYTSSMADFTALLPPASSPVDEPAQRAWLLRELVPATQRQFNGSLKTSLADLSLEYSHVELSSSLWFDALTIEADVDPRALANIVSSPDGTRYTNLPLLDSAGPWPGLSFVNKTNYSASIADYDPPVQIIVFSPCADDRGNEKLTYKVTPKPRGFAESMVCSQVSTSSLFVISIAKRLTADTLTHKQSVNTSGVFTNAASSVATNLRKTFSFTIGRLSWRLDDVAETFHADCQAGDAASSNCQGLSLPLTASSPGAAQQHLVVGASALPLDQLLPYETAISVRGRRVALARVNEPDSALRYESNRYLAGDVLLPHNIRTLSWDAAANRTATFASCKDEVEDRLRLAVDNHLYMEHSLQPAYTAAALFLFQQAVVRDAITFGDNRSSLAFEGNEQFVGLRLSIPTQNAWLTLAGCVVLVLGVLVALLCSADSLASITASHTIVRVLLDDKQFPSLLLRREVVDGVTGTSELGQFQIAALSLEPAPMSKHAGSRHDSLSATKHDSDQHSQA